MMKFWKPKSTSAESITPEETPSDGPLQAVFSCYSPVEAHIISGMLEDAGIECTLSNEMFAYADNPISNASGGVQVFVRPADTAEARALIEEAEASKADTQ